MAFRVLIVVDLIVSATLLALAPNVLPQGYSIVAHTLSEAGAQATEGAWLARTGFLTFGIGVLWLSILNREWPPSARWFHGAFGVLMVAAAVYSHRPFADGVPYDRFENTLHSIAATTMGFAFALGVLVVIWARIPRLRVVDVLAVAASVLVPLAMVAFDDWPGLLQRGMFLVAYVWYVFETLGSRQRSALDPIV